MFGMFGGGGMGNQSFEAYYRCYPVSFIDKLDAENGDKVFLPPSALDRLASLHIDYPMLFRVENKRDGRVTHCGVLEFIADEGMVYMPYWMMQNMLLQEGDVVQFKNATLPKGTYVKLQPHTKDFLDISNPKAVLERTLRGYSCLTVGDCICLHYNGRKYYIDIVEAKPGSAVSVIETDCEVDFAPPLDYVEPGRDEGPAAAAAGAAGAAAAGAAAGANGAAAGGAAAGGAGGGAGQAAGGEGEAEAEEPKFAAFRGSGFRLDGKAVVSQPLPPPGASGSGGGASTSGGGGGAADKRPAGKVVFGGGNRLLSRRKEGEAGAPGSSSSGGAAAAAPPKAGGGGDDAKKDGDDAKDKFAAFSGKSFSLKG